MENIHISWVEFDSYGYQEACKFNPAATNPKDFEHVFEGTVIDSYHSFLGTPRFVVILKDGNIVTRKMEGCKVENH